MSKNNNNSKKNLSVNLFLFPVSFSPSRELEALPLAHCVTGIS